MINRLTGPRCLLVTLRRQSPRPQRRRRAGRQFAMDERTESGADWASRLFRCRMERIFVRNGKIDHIGFVCLYLNFNLHSQERTILVRFVPIQHGLAGKLARAPRFPSGHWAETQLAYGTRPTLGAPMERIRSRKSGLPGCNHRHYESMIDQYSKL